MLISWKLLCYFEHVETVAELLDFETFVHLIRAF